MHLTETIQKVRKLSKVFIHSYRHSLCTHIQACILDIPDVHTFRLAFYPPLHSLTHSHTGTHRHRWAKKCMHSKKNSTDLRTALHLISALDGVRYSNTLALERVLGWKGVLIEASLTSFSELQEHRPFHLHVNAAVCARKQTVHFLEHPDSCCRGIAQFLSVLCRDSWYSSLSPHGGWHFTDLTKTIPIRHINCLPLKQLLAPLKENGKA